MSDCKDKKCKDCNEDYLQGMLPCVTLPELCVDGETCEETYNANCVRYTGSAVVCGTTTVLSTGMTTQEALISLANAICLSGGGGLVDLTPLEQCCATNTTNITNLQTNLTIVNTTLTTISTQITTINTQITALQECCDASVKKCPNGDFPVAYALIGCTPDEKVTGQDLFYIDRQHAGLTENQITPANISPNWSGALALNPVETAAAFYVRAFSDAFGVSWQHNPVAPLVPDPSATYYPVIQAGSFQIPYQNHYSTILNADAYIGLSGIAGYTLLNDLHISISGPGAPIEAIGIQGIASTSDIENIGGEFISKWRGATSGKNTAIRGRANGSNLNSGYDIEVGLTTDANKTNVGGKIIVKSGAGGTNHGLKIDVSQALGVTYAIQLKDTTAAAGKFLKAVDSDGNAIWDTVNAGGTVPPGVVSNNNINGTTNYVTKWTAADKIGDSIIQDNGSQIAINTAPSAGAQFRMITTNSTGINIQQTTTSNSNFCIAYDAYVSVATTDNNTGFSASVTDGTSQNVGLRLSVGTASFIGNPGYDIGVIARVANTTRGNIGGFFVATGGTTNYSLQLQDGTHTVAGRYLRNMDATGKANWVNITAADVQGAVGAVSGINNYIAKFTPNGTTIGNSQIIDDGTSIGIGTSPNSFYKIFLIGSVGGGIWSEVNSGSNDGVGLLGKAQIVGGTHPSGNSGVVGYGLSSNVLNVGISGNAYGNSAATTLNIGGKFESGTGVTSIGIYANATSSTNRYAAQLKDGTETVAGRYLRNMTIDGKANWANINITEVTNGLSSTLLGAPNGIATLDNNSKLVMSQMPISVMDYKGTFNPTVPSPPLQDGVGNTGDVYAVSAAGTYTFGAGNTLTLGVGDWVIYNGTKWEKTLGNNVGAGTVTSVGLTVGTTGTDVNISNSPITTSGAIALNIPTASATARGLLSIADWNTFSGKVSGPLGTTNFVARFVGTNLIGNGCIQDIGTSVSIGNAAPSTSIKLVVANTGAEDAIKGYTNASGKIGVYGVNDGSNAGTNTGVQGDASGSTTINIGVKGTGSSITGGGYGVYGTCTGSGVSVGIYGEAASGTSKYAIQLKDGTETVAGRFLKNITTDGKANWANITAADISGVVGAVNGENNYVAKFTPNGTTIGKSLIQDDGTNLSIGTVPVTNALFKLSSSSTDSTIQTFNSQNSSNAIFGSASGSNSSGGSFTTTGTSGTLSGVVGSATGAGGNNYGGKFSATNGITNYSVQLLDGSETATGGKYLKDTSNGKANWAYLPDSAQLMCSDMTTPITASTALAKSFWIAPCNGQLTDIFANLYSPQAGGAIFTVTIKMNGATIASPSFTAGAQQSSIIPASNTFTKGTLFEVFVTQVGDGSAKGLLATINYLRT